MADEQSDLDPNGLLAAAAVGQMFGSQAHDLNNSLQAVTTALDILSARNRDDNAARMIGLAQGALGKAVEMVSVMHRFAKTVPLKSWDQPWHDDLKILLEGVAGLGVAVHVTGQGSDGLSIGQRHLINSMAILLVRAVRSAGAGLTQLDVVTSTELLTLIPQPARVPHLLAERLEMLRPFSLSLGFQLGVDETGALQLVFPL